MTIDTSTARERLCRAYDAAVSVLRAGESYAAPVPTAADVCRMLRLAGLVTTVDATRDDCAAIGLRLADARSEALGTLMAGERE